MMELSPREAASSSQDCESQSAYQCTFPGCSKRYARKFRLSEHQKSEHGVEDKLQCTRNFHCPFCSQDDDGRGASFRTNTELINHCERVHDDKLGKKILEFSSMTEFNSWKEREEDATYTTYVKNQQAYKPNSSEVKTRHYFICCRSGKHRINKQQRKTKEVRPHQKESRKLDSTCISQLYVDEHGDGHISVTYISAHTHELGPCELKHLPLPQSTKQEVSMKISLGVPTERILEDVRETVGDRTKRQEFDQCVSRKHFLTKSDVRNIKVKVDDRIIKRHDDDATSVTMMVAELQQEVFDPVVIFKPQGSKDDSHPALQTDSFVLVIQTQFQMELYQKYASTILCIDSTHGTNQYRFKLISIVVPDEYGKGQPVGWCISDSEAGDVIGAFLGAIQGRSPSTSVNIIMTDDDNTGWSAAKGVFGDSLKHLLCHWHVDRAWKNKLKSVKPEHQPEMYQTLCILRLEHNPDVFQERVTKFTKLWLPIEPDFVQYFNKFYVNRAEKWAKCYRHFAHGDTDTNMYLESFHNQLKTVHLNGRVNRRIDFLLHHLLKYEKDIFFNYQRTRQLPSAMCNKIRKEVTRHERGLQIPASDVQKQKEGLWHVESQSGCNPEGYSVSLVLTTCPVCSSIQEIRQELVICRAPECHFLCLHMYKCDSTCYDFNNDHLCKHIHRVHSLEYGNQPIPDHDEQEPDGLLSPEIDLSYAESVFCREKDSTIQLNSFQSLLRELQTTVTHQNDTVVQYLPHINALLERAVSVCRAAETATNAPTQSLEKQETIHPGQTKELQWRFKQTAKCPGRKKSGLILSTKLYFRHPNVEERTAIISKLKEGQEIVTTEQFSDENKTTVSQKNPTEIQTGQKRKKLACVCSGCLAKDCGSCKFCLDMPKFGGPGKKKKRCIERVCCNKSSTTQTTTKALTDITNISKFNGIPTCSKLKPADASITRHSTDEIIQGIFMSNPQFVALPGSSVTDIPIPDDMQRKPPGAPKSGYAVLVPFLQQQGRAVDRVLGDGNCLFRSLSLQLTGTQDHHLELRRVIAEFEKSNGVFEHLHNTINKTPFPSHLQNIRKSCVWGTNIEIMATSSLFQLDVYVATESYHPGRPMWLKYIPRTAPPQKDAKLTSNLDPHLGKSLQRGWIEVVHVCQSHFDAIKPLPGAMLVRPSLSLTASSSIDLTD